MRYHKAEYRGDRLVRDAATAVFLVLISLLGAAMMAVGSSPLVKGASFLWLPAALQLIAGVWLDPTRGFIAAGLGAQAAGIIAYGGWGPPDWIMNFFAGGFANAFLPAILMRVMNINSDFQTQPQGLSRASLALLFIAMVAIALALLQLAFGKKLGIDGPQGFILPVIIIFIVPLVWRSAVNLNREYVLSVVIVTLSCAVSAALGTLGAVVGGQSWQAAVFSTGIGWFLGDTASSILGLYMLAQFTERARKVGLAPLAS